MLGKDLDCLLADINSPVKYLEILDQKDLWERERVWERKDFLTEASYEQYYLQL